METRKIWRRALELNSKEKDLCDGPRKDCMVRYRKMSLTHIKGKKEECRRNKLTSLHNITNVHIYSLVNVITSTSFHLFEIHVGN
jgi:hypothetical protein